MGDLSFYSERDARYGRVERNIEVALVLAASIVTIVWVSIPLGAGLLIGLGSILLFMRTASRRKHQEEQDDVRAYRSGGFRH